MLAGKQSTISPEERKWVKLTMALLLIVNDLNLHFAEGYFLHTRMSLSTMIYM